jgi:hypothetical protein
VRARQRVHTVGTHLVDQIVARELNLVEQHEVSALGLWHSSDTETTRQQHGWQGVAWLVRSL